MIISNINIGNNVIIDQSSRVNNIIIEDNVKIAGGVNIFGAESHLLVIGSGSYIGPNCFIEGYNALVNIGRNVSLAQRITIISGSEPNASSQLKKIFPKQVGPVKIGNHSWIGAHSIIMPNVELGVFCVVAANSFVNKSFPNYSIIGGSPAKLIRFLTESEINKLHD